jgi:predicted nuclease of restriction endonuclease-like (RecB) superfamily
MSKLSQSSTALLANITTLIEEARSVVIQRVNASLVVLHWQIGAYINQALLQDKRADYGEQLIETLATPLTKSYGRGFNKRSLFRMVQFAKQFPDQNIVSTLSTQLSWSHFVEMLSIDDSLKREFYVELCSLEHWSVRELRKKIEGQLYERTAIAKQPDTLIKQELAQLREEKAFSKSLAFRDPYFLDFLNLPANYSETTLENAILDELCQFIQELGTDFCFVARQKRIMIDNDDYYIDLLMFHRGLRRLVAIELKLGHFKASHKGQMELYLKWLDKYERRQGEEQPLGLVLCADKKAEHIELLELDKSGIHVAQYLTELPEKALLEEKLRLAISAAKQKENREQLGLEDKTL